MSNEIEETKISIIFKNRLLDLIDDDDDDKSKLPKKIGIAYSTFTRAVNFGIIPKVITLINIADYFQVSLEYLLGKTENENFYPSIKQKTFYERLTDLRIANSIENDSVLANNLHIERQIVYRWKSKNYLPNLETLELLSDYFKVPIDFLLGRID